MADDWILLRPEPFDTAKAIAFVSADDRAGGIAIFLGTTRAEGELPRKLIALNYEAYDEMAIKQMHDLAAAARQKWPILKLVIWHRTGEVRLTRPSVVIAVSTPHRADAFDACRFIIDQLKKDVAIWKKEVWSTGDETWVHPTSDK